MVTLAPFPEDHPYLDAMHQRVDRDEILRLRARARTRFASNRSLARFAAAYAEISAFKTRHTVFNHEVVEIGEASELDEDAKRKIVECLQAFKPWKKGPFRLFGHHIDAEWQSQLKWQRFAPHLGELRGKIIADIGCHNGYYLYRLAAYDPRLVIGFEPNPKLWYTFHFLQRFAQRPELAFELLGVEELGCYPQFFDVIFCLGILYHHHDPIGLLRLMHQSLRRKGRLFIDCQGIPGEEAVALMPVARYAGAGSTWWLPTLSCLVTWLKRVNFKEVRCLYAAALSSEEQRATVWAPLASLEAFIDPQDAGKTIEGYPAPWRFYLEARK